jgi:hypothetical protein
MKTFIPVVVLALVIALSYHEVKSQGVTSFSGSVAKFTSYTIY